MKSKGRDCRLVYRRPVIGALLLPARVVSRRLLHCGEDVLGHVLHVQSFQSREGALHVEQLEHGLPTDRDDERAFARFFFVHRDLNARQGFGQPIRPGLERASALAGLDLYDGAARRLGGRFGLGSRGLLGRRFGFGFLRHGLRSGGFAGASQSLETDEAETCYQLFHKMGEHSLASGL